MIARLYVALPFTFTLRVGAAFEAYEYNEDDYQIRIYPPVKSDEPTHNAAADVIRIDDQVGFEANALQIDFRREAFDRRSSVECDPPYDLIRQTINGFLARVRFVTRGYQVRPITFPHTTWRLEYLDEDGAELQATEGLVKGRGALVFDVSWIGITPEIWNEIHELPVNYTPLEWDELTLDAKAALPAIGPAVVLAATALEVFIAHVLDALAVNKVLPYELWSWINKREWLRAPSVEEQFDGLLRTLLGSSLKENKDLWDAFMKLKTARNEFVHGGVALVGKKPVTEDQARQLVNGAAEIISFVRAKLPTEMQWPEYEHKVSLSWGKKLPLS